MSDVRKTIGTFYVRLSDVVIMCLFIFYISFSFYNLITLSSIFHSLLFLYIDPSSVGFFWSDFDESRNIFFL